MAIKFEIYTMEAYSYSLNLILIKYYDNLRSKLGNEKSTSFPLCNAQLVII